MFELYMEARMGECNTRAVVVVVVAGVWLVFSLFRCSKLGVAVVVVVIIAVGVL